MNSLRLNMYMKSFMQIQFEFVVSWISMQTRYVCSINSSHSVTWSLGHSVTQSLSHSVTWSLGHLVNQSLGHSVTRSLSHSVTRFQRCEWRTDGQTTSGSTGLLRRQQEEHVMNYVSMTMKRLGYKKLIFKNVSKQSIFILEDLQPIYNIVSCRYFIRRTGTDRR